MHDDAIFLDTVSEMSQRAGGTEWDSIRACGLLRHLLLDEQTLIDRVNKPEDRRLDIRYEVMGTIESGLVYNPAFGIPKPVSAFILDGLYPPAARAQPLPPLPTFSLKRDKFLSFVVGWVDGNVEVTVKDVIRFMAHVRGGVHTGSPRGSVEEAIEEFDGLIRLGDQGMVLRTVRGIGMVVTDALHPLVDVITAEHS